MLFSVNPDYTSQAVLLLIESAIFRANFLQLQLSHCGTSTFK